MARFYKGSGPGTYYWLPEHDPRIHGFQAPIGAPPGPDGAIRHITNYSAPSPYVSVTTSYAVARSYAISGPFGLASQTMPGKVWEIQIDVPRSPPPANPTLLIAGQYPDFFAHDGDPDLLLELARGNPPQGRSVDGFQVNWRVSHELLAIVRALRDAEALADRILPGCVVAQLPVW